MDRKIPFSNLQDINKKCKGKNIVLFGCGNIAEKTARILTENKIKAIVDNASNVWGQTQLDIELTSPDYLKMKKNSFVLICTTSFVEVAMQLNSFGMIAEKVIM